MSLLAECAVPDQWFSTIIKLNSILEANQLLATLTNAKKQVDLIQK